MLPSVQMERCFAVLTSRTFRRLAGWALRATGPVVLAVLLIRVVDYGELRDILGDLRVAWLLAALGAMQLIILLRTLRWIELHRAFGLPPAGFIYQLRLAYATSMATVVLPQIINPLSRFALLVQDGYRAKRALAGSALEKALELAAYVAFGLYGSIVLASSFGGLVWWAIAVAVAAVAGSAALFAQRHRLSSIATMLIERMPGLGDRADAGREEVAQEIVALDRAVWLRLAAWSFAIAMTQATMLFLLTRSLGVDLSYPYMVAVWGVIAFSFLLPLTVNGIGTREVILVAAFSAADRSTDAAVAIGLLTLAVVAVGSSPGIVEWLRRFLVGGARQVTNESNGSAIDAQINAHPQGERRT